MILTDREIQIAIDRDLVKIDPAPGEKAFSSTSVDLTLDPNLTRYNKPTPGVETIIDPSQIDFSPETSLAHYTTQLVIPDDGFALPCNELFLAWTIETVHIKIESKLAARIEGKSSLARLGLGVHVTAPTIHSGFKGRIRLEMINHGRHPIRLRSKMRIAQLIFELTLGTPDKGYSGQFSGQSAPPSAH